MDWVATAAVQPVEGGAANGRTESTTAAGALLGPRRKKGCASADVWQARGGRLVSKGIPDVIAQAL